MEITALGDLDGKVYAIHTFEDELTTGEKCYLAYHPEFDYEGIHRCMSQGATEREAIHNLKDALEGMLESFRKCSLPIPEPNSHLRRTW